MMEMTIIVLKWYKFSAFNQKNGKFSWLGHILGKKDDLKQIFDEKTRFLCWK